MALPKLYIVSRSFLNNLNLPSRTCCLRFRNPTEQARHFVSRTNQDVPKPPKRPATAFFEFIQMEREEILSNNPGIKNRDVLKMTAKMWWALDEAVRQEFLERARKRHQAYRVIYDSFLLELSAEDKEKLVKNKRLKKLTRARLQKKKELHEMGKPKQPLSSFVLFLRATSVERGGLSVSAIEFMKSVSVIWNQMDEEEKRIYQDEAAREKERYEDKIKKWEQEMISKGREDLVRKKSRPKIGRRLKKKTVSKQT